MTDNSPVMARYTTTDGEVHYSNILFVDYYNLGPLPALQLETNLTMTDGAYHITRGDFIRAAITNLSDYEGKGAYTEFRLYILDRSGEYERRVDYEEVDFDAFHTEIGLSTWKTEAREEPYYLKATITSQNNVWEDSIVEIPLYVDQDAEMPDGIRIEASKTEAETLETIHIRVSAPGAEYIELFRGPKDDCDNVDSSNNEYAEATVTFSEAGTEYFWARVRYEDDTGNETTEDSDVLTIAVSAPHGDLEDVLSAAIPSQAQAYQPFTAGTVSRSTDNPVTPDKLLVNVKQYNYYWGDEYTAGHTSELTFPATDEDGNWSFEPGKVYDVSVKAWKQGYNPVAFYRTVYVPDPAAQNNAELTVNGKTTETALANGSEYTVSVTGLPAGVTMVAIQDVGGSSWSHFYPEEGETSVSETYTLRTAETRAEIYALFTTDPNPENYYNLNVPWDGCTNAVPVTITCSHEETYENTDWEYMYFVPDGKEYHRIYAHGEVWSYCQWCEKKLACVDVIQYDGRRDRHTFNSEGVCEDYCGYQCPHDAADVERRWRWEDEPTVTANDTYNHHVTGTKIDYDLCTNCRAYLENETQRTVDEDEKHDFNYNYYCHVCEASYPDNYLNVDVMDGCQQYMDVQAGADVTVGVTAESSLSDELTYQWYDAQDTGDGTYVPVEGATQSTFTLENCSTKRDLYVQVSDGYVQYEQYFYITIDNEFSAYASDATNLYVTLNSTAELRVDGYCREGTLSYQWYREVYQPEWGYSTYEPIPDTDTPSLTTVPITQTEYYKCKVSDVYGNSTEIWFTVQVNSHLKVTANGGTNASAAPGGDVTMSVTATSDYPGQITYQWSREINDEWSTSYEDIPGATGPSLTVSNLTEHRYYHVEVTDGYMKDYVNFSAIVDSRMDAYIDGDTEVTADYGTQVTFSVKATDMFDGAGITYRWYRWRNYPDSYDQYAEELGSGADLEITALDPGIIYCDVRNEYGMMVLDAELIVDTHLIADAESNQYKVTYGEPLTLQVNATTLTGAYTCTWSSEDMDGSDRQEIPGETGSTLQIDAVTEPMFYFCVVDDGVATYGVNYILVEPDTQLTAVPVTPTAFAVTGESVTMTVSASSMLGAEAITCRWTRTDRTYGGSEEIDGANGLSLTVQETGDAYYRCDITDGVNETYVRFLTCTQSESFYYNDQSNFDVNYGDSVTMGVTAASPEGPAVYRWRRGNTVLEGQTGPTLTVTATENTEYFCDVYFGDSTVPYNTEWFWIRIMNTFDNHIVDNRAIWVVPQEGLTLSTDITSRDGGELTYSWTRDDSAIPVGTGSSLDVAYEAECRLIHYTCVVSDVYGNTLQLSFPCLFGTPETIQAGTTVTCTEDNKFVRFTPAASAVYAMTLTGNVYDALLYPSGSDEEARQLDHGETTEMRLQGGMDYYIRLTEGHVLTVALKQEEQEAYAFSLRRNDRIRVPAMTINGGDYPVTNLVSSDPSTVYANGDVIRALKTGNATVTATYEGGIATRVFTITVTKGPLLKLPYDLNEIRADAFAGDTGLRFIELGSNVRNVRSGAFANAGSLTVYVNSYNTVFDDGAFTGSSPAIICRKYSPVAIYCSEKGLLYFCQED